MNKKGFELNLLGRSLLFLVLFIIGGIFGSASLPYFQGRFFISGIVFALAAMGLVQLIIHWPKN